MPSLPVRRFWNVFLGSGRKSRRISSQRNIVAANVEVLENRLLLTRFLVDITAGPGGDGSIENPFQTIQEGVNAAFANPGADLVDIVRPGTYVENIFISDSDAVHVAGVDGVVIDGGGGDVFTLTQSHTVLLENLAIQNGDRGIKATGAFTRPSDLQLVGVDFSQNQRADVEASLMGDITIAYSTFTGDPDMPVAADGVFISESGNILIQESTFQNHTNDGLQVVRSGNVDLIDVTTINNKRHGIAVFDNGATVTLSNVTATGNAQSGLRVFDGLDNADTEVFVTSGVYSGNKFHGMDFDETLTIDIREATVENNGANGRNGRTFGGGISVNTRTVDANTDSPAPVFRLMNSSIRNNTAGISGGGLAIFGSVLSTIIGTEISDNHAIDDAGGGIAFFSTALGSMIRNSTIHHNTTGFLGGGIAYIQPEDTTPGTLLIEQSTLSDNLAFNAGGGLYSANQNLTIRQSLIVGNESRDDGGGLLLRGSATVENSTISGNLAVDGGGVAIRDNPAFIRFNHTTITQNTASEIGGGMHITTGSDVTRQLANSIIAQNTAGISSPDISGTFQNLSFNLIGDATGSNANTTSPLIGTATNPVDARLDILRDNGGATRTHALLSDSPAIDAVGATNLPLATDQRGARRIQYQGDVGAYEVQPPLDLTLVIRADRLDENGRSSSTVGQVLLSGGTHFEDLTVTLTPDILGALDFPVEVVIPQGETTSEFFDVVAIDNSIGNGDQTVVITASAPGFAAVTDQVIVTDDDAPNGPPVAQDQAVSLDEDNSISGQVTANDPDGDSLTYQLIDGPTHHFAFSFSSSGSFYYAPQENFHGTESFTFRASDGRQFSNIATVSIVVNPVNDLPITVSDSVETNEDTPITIGVLANDVDADGDDLTVHLEQGVTSGTLVINPNGTFTYTPNTNFNGMDSFRYFVDDGTTTSSSASVHIAVNAVNDAPVAVDDQYTLLEDGSLQLSAPGLLANDFDADHDTFTLELLTGTTNGDLSINPDGSFSYTPDVNFHGTDSLTYQITDGTEFSTPATVTLIVTPAEDLPTAGDDSISTLEDTSLSIDVATLLANDGDADGDLLSIVSVAQGSHGTPELAGATITFTPGPDFFGTASFTYQVTDGNGNFDTGTVFVDVQPVNDGPIANPDSATTDEDSTATVKVLLNDTDADPLDTLTVQAVSTASHGSTQINPDGTITYTPNPDYHGPDSFTYTLGDGNGGVDMGTVSITVNSVNDAPIAGDDLYATNEDNPLSVSAESGLLSNDTDPDESPLTIRLVSNVSHGSLTVNSDGSFSYTPNPDFHGMDSFTYVANDGTTDSNAATVSITINSINDPPVANDDSITTNEDTQITIDVLANDEDIEGDSLVIDPQASPTNGSIQIVQGQIVYTPNEDYFGSDSFTYLLSDGSATSDPGTVSITINPVNDPPAIVGDAFDVDEDNVLTIAAPGLLANDSDIDGDGLVAALDVGPSNGSLTLNSDGSFSYTPDPNFNGTDSFVYHVSDGSLDSTPSTVTITVNPVNDAPVTSDQSFNLSENAPSGTVVGQVAASDVDGDNLIFEITAGNDFGAFTIAADGTLSVADPLLLDFETHPVFVLTVSVTDGDLSATAVVTIPLMDVNETFIDIQPGDADNIISLGKKSKIEVAIFSSIAFDATRIDIHSLRFGVNGDEDSLIRKGRHQNPQFRLEDLNGDGRLDLVAVFDANLTGLDFTDTEVNLTLTGSTLDGEVFIASDTVVIHSGGGGKGNGNGNGKGNGKNQLRALDQFFANYAR